MKKFLGLVPLIGAAVLLSAAAAPNDIPHRKAGWWQLSTQMPGGRTMARNLCLDATSDIRNNVLKPIDGCTMTAEKLPTGYKYRKACGAEVTTGSAVGDFNSAYTITEARGARSVKTEAKWMGTCPPPHHADEMWR